MLTHHQLSSHCCLEYDVKCARLIHKKLQISSKRKILQLHYTRDSIYRKRRSDGVGAEKQSAVLFSKKEENKLWEQGVIGKDSPTALLRVFYNGKNI